MLDLRELSSRLTSGPSRSRRESRRVTPEQFESVSSSIESVVVTAGAIDLASTPNALGAGIFGALRTVTEEG